MLAIITGGASGIGAAISERLAADGFTIVVADLHREGAVAQAQKLGGGSIGLPVDVSDPASVAQLFDSVRLMFGHLDVLVNNAGIASLHPFTQFPHAVWNKTLAVNLTGPFLMSQAAVPLMSAGGRIVNVASIAGVRASTGRTAYGASKAGVIGLTAQLAIELADLGITVNAIAPGPVETPLVKELHSDRARASYVRQVPMHRYADPSEIAGAVAFLCSADASYVTGHTLPVDGGFLSAGVLEG